MCSYRWREQMYSRFQRWRFCFIHNGEYTHGGNKYFHLFNINVFFNSYRWMYSWREQMYSRFQRWRIFLFITVNILMEGTNVITFHLFNINVFFNSYRWMYSWREQMYSRFQRWRIFLFITNILIDGTNGFTFLTLMCFLILTGECIHGGNKCNHVFNVDGFFYS